MTTYPARPSQFTQITTTADWEKLHVAMGIWDGIDGTNSMVPTFDTPGRNIQISAGTVFVKGEMWWCDAIAPTPIPPASAKDRKDVLVLRYDRGASAAASVVLPTVLSGVADGSLALPPIQQTPTGFWDIPVCNWITRASGTFDTLVDTRQFSGHSVVAMISTARPVPPHPRLALETDTGYLQRWDGTSWRNIGPKNQIVQTGNTVTSTGYSDMFTEFAIPANDSSLGPVSYRIRCGGVGVQATGTPVPFGIMVSAFGKVWGESQDTGGISAGSHFNWDLNAELVVSANGQASFYGDFTISHAVYNPSPSTSRQAMAGQLGAGGVATNVATSIGVKCAWTNVANHPSISCYGATFDRVAN